MALKIRIVNMEEINDAIIKTASSAEPNEPTEDTIKPGESKEFHLYGHQYLTVSQR